MGGRKTSARFDMRTLKRHAQQDRRTEESAKRATNVLGTAATTDSAALDESGADLGARKQGLARIVAQHSKGEDVSFEKVMRAVERVHDSMGHGPWYFFDTTRLPSTRIPSNFPSEALRKAGGPWAVLGSSCCRDARQRDWRFTSGMVRAVVRNGHRLPLPLVDWMLFEAVPTECSAALRDEYIRLLAAEPSHTGSRLTADRVFDLFVGLGMVADVQRNMDVRIRIRSRMEEGPLPPPHDYAWENLRAVLRTLTAVAPGMSVDALSMALRILLMMGVDRVIVRNSDVAVDYQDAIEALASAVPDDQWDSVVSWVSSLVPGRGRRESRKCHL